MANVNGKSVVGPQPIQIGALGIVVRSLGSTRRHVVVGWLGPDDMPKIGRLTYDNHPLALLQKVDDNWVYTSTGATVLTLIAVKSAPHPIVPNALYLPGYNYMP